MILNNNMDRLPKKLLIYYAIMVVLLATYFSLDAPINNAIRIGYLLLLFIPTLSFINAFPAVCVCFYGISCSSFAYTLMPSNQAIYVVMALIAGVLALSRQHNNNRDYPFYIILFAYFLLIDLISSYKIGNCSYVIMLCLIISLSSVKYEHSNRFLEYCFIVATIVLSSWFIFFPEARINTYNFTDVEGLEQTGWIDPNYFGVELGIGIVIALYRLLTQKDSTTYRIVEAVTIVLGIWASLLNASRGTLLAVAVCFVYILFMSKNKKNVKIVATISIGVLIYFLYTSSVFDLIEARMSVEDRDASGRFGIWAEKLKAFGEADVFTYLFGCGYDNAMKISGRLKAFHNDYVAALVSYGVIGFSLFVSALLRPIIRTKKLGNKEIITYILYIAVCCMSIEPIISGRFMLIAFYMFIVQRASQIKMSKY